MNKLIISLAFVFALCISQTASAQVTIPQEIVPYVFGNSIHNRHLNYHHHHYYPVYPRYIYPRYGYGYYYQTQPYFGVYPRVYNGDVQMGIYFNNGYLLGR